MRRVLLFFALKYNGNWVKIYQALEHKEKIDFLELEEIENKITCSYVTIVDTLYPKSLCEINRPPFVLFYYGDIKLLNTKQHKLSVCGTNEPDDYGLGVAKLFIKKLIEKKVNLVLTPEQGINLNLLTKTILNQGAHITIIVTNMQQAKKYFQNQKHECCKIVISETYRSNRKIQYDLYRLVAGIVDGILLLQSRIEDQTYQLVNLVSHYGKDVFCIPERITVPNQNNRLIKDGAKLVESIEDIISEL